MATQADLFLAILALDAYNRGYNPGMTFAGNSDSIGTGIGDATIQLTSNTLSQAASFFAVAYSWEGETVISYRGTTFPGAPDLGDVLNGWTLSIGYAQAAQAQMALDFYTQVRSQIAAAADSQVIQLTGHSLGGGLAGFVGDLEGAPADIFNNIPFGTGVAAEIDKVGKVPGGSVPLVSSNVRQFITDGEVATGLRATTGLWSASTFLSQGMEADQVAYLVGRGLGLDNSTVSQTLYSNVGYGNGDPTNLHSQSLMVLLLYANVNNKTDWSSIGLQLYNALFNDTIAKAVGFVKTDDGWYRPSAKMLAAIAYSAITEGVMPFGDTGIASLFNDADALGNLVTERRLTSLVSVDSVTNALSEILVQFAADQAKRGETDQDFTGGALEWDGQALKVDLDPTHWTSTYNTGTASIIGIQDFANAVWQELILAIADPGVATAELMLLANKVSAFASSGGITEILAAAASGANLDATDAPPESDGQAGEAILVGADGIGTLSAGDTNNLIIGGSKVVVGNGDNIIVGEGATETFQLGLGSNTVVEISGRDTVDYTTLDKSDSPSTFTLTAGQHGAVVVSKAVADSSQPPGSDNLYNVENLKFGAGADDVIVSAGTDLTGIKSIDGGGNPDGTKDILDLSGYGAKLQLVNGHIIGDHIDIKIDNFEEVKLPSLGNDDKLTPGSLRQLYTGDGNDNVVATPGPMLIDLGGGNNTLTGAGDGAVVTGSGNDTIEISHKGQLLFEGAKTTDRLTYYGNILTGGVRWINSESIWAYGAHGERYGRNAKGDLIIDDGRGDQTFVPGFNFDINSGAQTAGIYVIQVTFKIEGGDIWTAPFLSAASILDALKKIKKALYGDPLVLDLTGNGIALSNQQASGVSFDINNNGFAAGVGWLGQGDGFLVRDINGNGQIDNAGEMFGSQSGSGFADLATLDGNHDGVISAADNGLADLNGDGKIDASDRFDSLKVWVDANGDGKVDPGELKSLADLGIVSISLASTASTATVNGNVIAATATFQRADGTTGTIADVGLGTDNFNTTWLGDRTVSAAAAQRPELKGFGTLWRTRRSAAQLPIGGMATCMQNAA